MSYWTQTRHHLIGVSLKAVNFPPGSLGRFSEDEVGRLGSSVVNALIKCCLHQRVFAILGLVLLWMWFAVKWPTKKKCCGSTSEKATQLRTVCSRVSRSLHIFYLHIIFTPYVSIDIFLREWRRKYLKGKKNQFFWKGERSWKVYNFFFPKWR